MPDLRFFAIPAALFVGAMAYVTTNPAGVAVEPIATAETGVTNTAYPTIAPDSTATRVVKGDQLPGLSGRLTYQSSHGLVTVRFPEGALVDSPPIEPDFGGSDDGVWQDRVDCDETNCAISLLTRDGRVTEIDWRYNVTSTAWQPGTHAFAFAAAPSFSSPAQRIIVVGDAATPVTRVAYEPADARVIDAFAWYGAGLLVATRSEGGSSIEHVAADGMMRTLTDDIAPIAWLYPSPDQRTYAFTQLRDEGWRLAALDAEAGTVTDYGLMGSDGAGSLPVPLSFEVKGPMAVAWSPDGSRIAFGGGFDPPYLMTIVDLGSSAVARTEFPSGYPGEMRWNSAGTQVAVSTYDIERKHHETWVVEAATGVGRHLMDGCIIVWSPDDRFLAVHGEDILGISVVDVTTGARMRLTESESDAPLRWD